MDLVLRRPAKYSIFRNEEEIKLFILVTFAEIHETVKKKGGKLFFADETHVQQDSGNLRGFTIVGKAPKLIHNPKNFWTQSMFFINCYFARRRYDIYTRNRKNISCRIHRLARKCFKRQYKYHDSYHS